MIQNMPKASITIPVGGMYQEWMSLIDLVEEDPDLNDMYVTLVCYSSESHDDENNENITVQFLYLHDDCPYGWDTLAKCGAKYMVIERPKK